MTMMFNNSLWGITPEAGAELDTIYLRHLRGETPDLAAIEARTGKQLGAKRAAMTIDNGTALVQLSGVMVRGAGLLGDISGATDPSAVQAEIEQAAADPTVQRIVLYVDSPGGSISGVAQLADALYSAGQNVDTVAVIDALGASAAYRVASQANTVLLADATSAAGSIGVILKHIDQSGADASRGVKVTEIKAGQFKGLGSPHKPLSEGDTSEMQRLVDSTYQTFLGAVQRGRGTSNQETMQMGDARIHQGQAAIDADLADGIGTLDQVLARPPRRVTAQQAAQAAPVIGAASSGDPHAIAAKARAYIDPQAALGYTVSAADAVRHVTGQTLGEVRAPQLAEHKPPHLAMVTLDPHVAAAWARAYIDQEAAAGRNVSAAEAVHEFQRLKGAK